MVSKHKEIKPTVTSINTDQIAICVTNMLHELLIAKQRLTTIEDTNNDRKQNSKSAYVKTSIYLLKAINNWTSKVQSKEYRATI